MTGTWSCICNQTWTLYFWFCMNRYLTWLNHSLARNVKLGCNRPDFVFSDHDVWLLDKLQAKYLFLPKIYLNVPKKIDQSEGFHFLYNSCKSCLFSKKSKIVIELRKNCTILEILLSNVAFVIAIAKLPYFFWLGQSCIFIMSYQMEWKRKIL